MAGTTARPAISAAPRTPQPIRSRPATAMSPIPFPGERAAALARPLARVGYADAAMGENRRGSLSLNLDLEQCTAASDRMRCGLHDGNRAAGFGGGNGQGFIPGKVVGEVAIEPVVVTRAQRQGLLVRATPFGGTEDLHASGEVGGHGLIEPLTDDCSASAKQVPLRVHGARAIRFKEAGLGAVREREIDAHLV